MDRWHRSRIAEGPAVTAKVIGLALVVLVGCGPGTTPPGTCTLEPVQIGQWPDDSAGEDASSTLRVYWDVSGGMQPHAAKMGAVLEGVQAAGLSAGVSGPADHRLIGVEIVPVAGAALARSLRKPSEPWSAIHEAATEAGRDLRAGEIGVAVFVSDLNVEVAKSQRKETTTICGAPTPVLPEAGALFGRCLNEGLVGTPRAEGRAREAWFGSVLGPSRPGNTSPAESDATPASAGDRLDPLFVLVLASNWVIGRRLTNELASGPLSTGAFEGEFAPTILADWAAPSVAPPNNCSWGPEDLIGIRRSSGSNTCSFLCDQKARLNLRCQPEIPLPPESAVTAPLITALPATLEVGPPGRVRAEEVPDAVGALDVEIACGEGPVGGEKVYDITVGGAQAWHVRKIDPGAGPNGNNVEDLFDSLLEMLHSGSPDRSWSFRVTIDDP